MEITLFVRRFGRHLATLCLPPSGTFAQTPAPTTVQGQVVDATKGRPLPYASVGVLGRSVGTAADEQGRLHLVVPAQYEADLLRISLVGYRPFTTTVRDFWRRTCPVETPCLVGLTASAQTAWASGPRNVTSVKRANAR
jgi:hypothetical protein